MLKVRRNGETMTNGIDRVGIVGASSLTGKELADELAASLLAVVDLVLLDVEALAGQVTAAGEEVSFIQRLDVSSFDSLDLAFFTGSADVANDQWAAARKAGTSVVDMTYALEGEKDVLVRAPWIDEALAVGGTSGSDGPDLGTSAVIAAHPAAVMLALVAARLKSLSNVTLLAATVMEPASEHGRLAMDELHQQTVKLLSFQPLPKEQYDAQVAFNMLPVLGNAAAIRLGETRRRIFAHYSVLSAGRLPELNLQLVQAPVFHGYAASVLIELAEPATVLQMEAALSGAHIDIVTGESNPPSNLSAAGQADVQVRVMKAAEGIPAGDDLVRRFWLWLAADNLKLSALNAVACALELGRLRPAGKIQ